MLTVKKDEEEAAAKKAEEERLRKEQEEAEKKAAEEKKKEEERNSLTGSAKEVANIQEILDKINNGEPVSDSEYAAALKTLFKSLNQDGKELKTELKDTINNNKEIFRTLMKNAGFDVDNDAQVEKFAEKAQGGLCVQLTLFLQGVRNGFTEPASMGEYFTTAVENGLMNERIWQVKSTQEVFDTVYGKDAVQVIGCGQDTGAKSGTSFKDAKGNPTGLNPAEVLSNLNQALTNSGATDITVRAKSTYSDYDHNMSIIKGSDGKYTLNDTKNRGTNIPVFDANGDFTDAFANFIKPETIRSFYYLKKN